MDEISMLREKKIYRAMVALSLALTLCAVAEAQTKETRRRVALASQIQGSDQSLRTRAAQYEPLMRAAAARYCVDPRALWTIAFLETRFRPRQISPKGARGMMQFMPATAATYGLADPFDAAAAIDAAARYVRDLSVRFGHRFDLVLAGYNAGEGTVEAYLHGVTLRTTDGRVINPSRRRTGGVPPYRETRNYVAEGLQVARFITATNIFAPGNLTAIGALDFPSPGRANPAQPVEVALTNTPAQTTPAPEENAALSERAPSSSYASVSAALTERAATASTASTVTLDAPLVVHSARSFIAVAPDAVNFGPKVASGRPREQDTRALDEDVISRPAVPRSVRAQGGKPAGEQSGQRSKASGL